jgi:prepilin-type N-terminal cleavage/methylation domain-containing protein
MRQEKNSILKYLKSAKLKRFTLIEVLVVVAIIGILASLLLPSLKKARDSARRGVCVNNLKNISTALLMYPDDNNDYFTFGSGRSGRTTTWDDLLGEGGYDGRNITTAVAALAQIADPADGSKIYYCPSAKFDYINTRGTGQPNRTYSFNENLGGYWNDSITINSVASPSSTILAFENLDAWSQGWRAAACYTYVDDARRHSHHNKSLFTVMSFVDGSVRNTSYIMTNIDQMYEID